MGRRAVGEDRYVYPRIRKNGTKVFVVEIGKKRIGTYRTIEMAREGRDYYEKTGEKLPPDAQGMKYIYRGNGKYRVRINDISLGTFDTVEEAMTVRDDFITGDGLIVCPVCGKPFYSDLDHRKYCSKGCQQNANVEKARAARRRERLKPETVTDSNEGYVQVSSKDYNPLTGQKKWKGYTPTHPEEKEKEARKKGERYRDWQKTDTFSSVEPIRDFNGNIISTKFKGEAI